MLGNYDKAIDQFLGCSKVDPANAAPLYQIAEINYELNKTAEALGYAEKAIRLEPENTWYLELYAELLVDAKKYKDAAEVYKKLTEKNPYNTTYFYDLALAYIYQEKYTEAIGVYDLVEKREGISSEIALHKETLYLKQNKINKAIEEIQKLIAAYPSETYNYYILADLYLNNKMSDEAFKVYEKIASIDANDPDIHLSLSDYYRRIGNNDKSFDELKLAFASATLDIDTKVKILLSYYDLSSGSSALKSQAYELLDILIRIHPGEAKAYSIYGDFLYRDKKLDEARTQYLKVIALDSSRYAVWEQLLMIESETGNDSSQAVESKEAIALFPEQAELYLFNGVANYKLKKYDEALLSLSKGALLVVYNDDLTEQFNTYLGDCYYAKNKIKEAFAAYDKVLSINSKNSYVLNNYSYYLALRGEDLGRAEKMARQALDLNPGASSYMDTYGWVLYKEQKYKDAGNWIEKAIENGGDSNGTILEHYGDVLYNLGETEKAVEYWEKSKKTGQGSPLLEKKITDKKLYE